MPLVIGRALTVPFFALGCLFVATAASAAPAVAPSPSPQPTATLSRTFATLRVNGNALGDALIAIGANDVFLRASDLARSGLKTFGGTRRVIAGEDYVSLRSLQPAFTYSLDMKTLVLDVIAQNAALLGTHVQDLAQQPREGTRYERDRGAFVNYAVAKAETGRPTGFFESGLTLPHSVLYQTVQYAQSGFSRGVTQMIADSRPKLRRTTIGDAAIGTGPLGGAAVLGGIVVARQFTLDPYLLTFPTPTLTGQVLLPSQADIYVNDQLVRTVELEPGQYVLQDVPSTIGLSRTRVVIRNALGITTQNASEFFSTAGLLRRGLTDYAFGAGLLRSTTLGGGNGYAKPALLGRYAVGVSDRFTLGGRIEAGEGLVSGGLNAVRTLGHLAVQLAGAASQVRGIGGLAGSLQVSAPSRGAIGLGAFAQWESKHYATLSVGPDLPRPLFTLGIDASAVLSRSTSLSVSSQQVIDSQNGPLSLLSIGLSQQLGRQMSLVVQEVRTRGHSVLGDATQNAFSVNLIRPIGLHDNLQVSRSIQSGSGGSTGATGVSFSHIAPGAYGLAYGGNAEVGSGRSASAAVQYQGQRGSAQLFLTASPQGNSAGLSATGGFAVVRNHFFLTRTIGDAYGLAEIPGLQGAQVYANNRYEGDTDRNGFLLIPDLVSQIPNEVRLELPRRSLDATISGDPSPVIPGFRSAVRFTYALQRVRAILVELLVQRKKGAPVVPEYGQATLTSNAKSATSEIDAGGRAYFDGLPAGRYAAKIEFSGESCDFAIDIPSHEQAILDIGTRTCVEP